MIPGTARQIGFVTILQILKHIHLLSAFHVAGTEKLFTCINSFNLHFYPTRYVLLLIFYTKEN